VCANRRGGALRHPDRSAPRFGLAIRLWGQDARCQIKFELMHLSFAHERLTARIVLAPHAVGLFIESAHELRNKIRRHHELLRPLL